jgi:hypothetical protein
MDVEHVNGAESFWVTFARDPHKDVIRLDPQGITHQAWRKAVIDLVAGAKCRL